MSGAGRMMRALVNRTKGSPATIEQIPVSDLPTESGHKRSPGACELKVTIFLLIYVTIA